MLAYISVFIMIIPRRINNFRPVYVSACALWAHVCVCVCVCVCEREREKEREREGKRKRKTSP